MNRTNLHPVSSCQYPDCDGPVVRVPGKPPKCYACVGRHPGTPWKNPSNIEHWRYKAILWYASPDDWPKKDQTITGP